MRALVAGGGMEPSMFSVGDSVSLVRGSLQDNEQGEQHTPRMRVGVRVW